jgi:hypothetical protein
MAASVAVEAVADVVASPPTVVEPAATLDGAKTAAADDGWKPEARGSDGVVCANAAFDNARDVASATNNGR